MCNAPFAIYGRIGGVTHAATIEALGITAAAMSGRGRETQTPQPDPGTRHRLRRALVPGRRAVTGDSGAVAG
jgi:hypothetical protein